MSEREQSIQPAKTLAKAFTAALILAIIIFLTIVLPAEYNIDPTGVGDKLGLTILAAPAPEQILVVAQIQGDSVVRKDETTITIPADKGLEYKFHLQQYAKLKYEWSSGESVLYFDLHGEPQGDTTGYFESFAEASSNEMKGSMTAPFEGSHGWYWRNDSDKEVVVSLKTQGSYEIIGLK